MIFALDIAYKFHRGFRKHIFISLSSFIAVISISIGIAVSIIALGIVNGFKYELNKRILSIIPHGEIILINPNKSCTDWKLLLDRIKKIPNITYSNPYINIDGIVEYNNVRNFIYIKSINLQENMNIYNRKLINFMEQSEWKYFCEHNNQIILGKGISIVLRVNPGDWVTIIFARNFDSKNKFLFNKIRMQVSGILNLHSQLDDNLAIISLSDAQKYCNNRTDVDGIEFFVNDVFHINRIVHKIKKEFDKNIKVRSWMDVYGYIYQDIQIVRVIIYLAIILIIVISCFNAVATLVISIKNKCNNIAILHALGARKILLQNIFLWYGFIIYGLSSLIGCSLGIFITYNIPYIATKCIDIFGGKIFSKGIYFIDFVPIYLSVLDVTILLSMVVIMGLLISWYLSLRIKKINLVQILK